MLDLLRKKMQGFAQKIQDTITQKKEPEPALTEKKTQPEFKPKIGMATQAKAIVSGKLVLSKQELAPALEEFELSLLAADVEQETATELAEKIGQELVAQAV